MSLFSFGFLLFLALVVVSYYILPPKYRWLCLLTASYVFCICVDKRMIIVLLIISFITFIGGKVIFYHKKLFYLFFMINMLVLFGYKYATNIAGTLGHSLDIVIPLGLSFYIFQTTTYLGDIKNGKIIPEKNILKYMAFVGFFPTVLSGPIQKARLFLPQLECKTKLTFDNLMKGTLLILWGFYQKLVVSDQLAVVVDKIYVNWENRGVILIFIAAVFFSFQIYADFSGYSDIARGAAKLFGIDIGKNFNNPYLAKTLSEFWKNWHTSLNTWLTEYIYIPLGGNRKGKIREYTNLLIVFLFSGMWHGAGLNYWIWGLLNGCLVLVEKIIQRLKKRKYESRFFVFIMITFTWMFFRIEDVSIIIQILKRSVYISTWKMGMEIMHMSCFNYICIAFSVLIFILVQYLRREEGKYYCVFKKQKSVYQILGIAILMYFIFFAMMKNESVTNTQFIYFQF